MFRPCFFRREWEGLVVNSNYDDEKRELTLTGVDSENNVIYKKVIPYPKNEKCEDWKIKETLRTICNLEICRVAGKNKEVKGIVREPTPEKPFYHMHVIISPRGYPVLPQKERVRKRGVGELVRRMRKMQTQQLNLF